jgi:hypothetical protein
MSFNLGKDNIKYSITHKQGRMVQKKFEALFFEASRPVRDGMLAEKPKYPLLTVPQVRNVEKYIPYLRHGEGLVGSLFLSTCCA